jgi:hypothetical protein
LIANLSAADLSLSFFPGVVMLRLVLSTLVSLLLISVNVQASSPPPGQDNSAQELQHPPEVPELAPDDPLAAQLYRLTLSGLVTLIIFCIGADLYRLLKALFQERFFVSSRPPRWPAPGQWVDPALNASPLATRSARKGWPMTFKDEGFKLVPETMDADKGTAQGALLCPNAGRRVGSWSMAPSTDSPNRFCLRLKLQDRDELAFSLRRAS